MNPWIFCDLFKPTTTQQLHPPVAFFPTSASSGSLKDFWGNLVPCFEVERALFTFAVALIFIIYSFDMCFL